MSRQQHYRVTDINGVTGTVLTTSRFLDDNPHRLIRLRDGQELLVPKQLLRPQDDGSYLLTASVADLLGGETRPAVDREVVEDVPARDRQRTSRVEEEAVIPVIEEELEVEKRVVESGRIRISKRVETTESIVDEPLIRESYDIQRSTVNRIVEELPKPHYEGDTLVLPILEEVLVVEKRLVLREEVRITPKREEMRDPETHTVRREHVEVERV